MKYLKATIILHKDKATLSTKDKKNIRKIRDYLYSLSCFDIDYLSSSFTVSDYRQSNIIIDMSSSQKLRTVAARSKHTFFLHLDYRKFEEDFVNARILLNFAISKLKSFIDTSKIAKLPTLYHLSMDSKLPSRLTPRNAGDNQPSTSDDPLLAENLPNRISFSTSIEGCFRAIYPNILELVKDSQGKPLEFYVYMLSKLTGPSMYMSPSELTEKRLVHDACFTSEYCFFKPVTITKIAKIGITIDKDPRSQKLTYGFFGGVPLGEDTGWAPDMSYNLLTRFSNKHTEMSKYELLLKDY